MPTWLLVIILLSVACLTTAYVTERICSNDFESEWIIIKLKNDSVEPTDIFICKECHQHENINWRYCKNCGRKMINGMGRQFYSEDIEI